MQKSNPNATKLRLVNEVYENRKNMNQQSSVRNADICVGYGGDGAGNTVEENSSVFSLIRMH